MNPFLRAASPFLMLLVIGTSLPLLAQDNHENHASAHMHERREVASRGDHPDNEDKMLFDRNQRRENWDYQEGWRYDQEAYFRGDLTPAPTPFDRQERHLPNHDNYDGRTP